MVGVLRDQSELDTSWVLTEGFPEEGTCEQKRGFSEGVSIPGGRTFQAEEAARWKHSSIFQEQQAARGP